MSTVIKVENLSKRYRIGLREKRKDTLFGQLGSMIKAPMENFRRLRSLSRFDADDESVFWALRDINFEVQQGEVLGIIGHNGAGKSTLLKILSRITEPSEGRITMKGRIGALLEVGTGFHQELTGRDNIYMNGTILGMSRREIDRKLDEIVDFSGIEKYIDTPVKFYSSGMSVRLGFSVAAHLEPEILIIDEVLSVGDAEFQNKCIGKLEKVSGEGRTVLFVSHNLDAVKSFCNKGIQISQGKLIISGSIDPVVKHYTKNLNIIPVGCLIENGVFDFSSHPDKKNSRYGILKAEVYSNDVRTNDVTSLHRITLKICYNRDSNYPDQEFGIKISTTEGRSLLALNQKHLNQKLFVKNKLQGEIIVEIPEFPIYGEDRIFITLFFGPLNGSYEILNHAIYLNIIRTNIYKANIHLDPKLNLAVVKSIKMYDA